MESELDEDFWEDLLILLDEGKVIPVIGAGLVTKGDDQALFYPWLARRLADKLGIEPERLGESPDLNTVAVLHLLNRGDGNELYTRIARILRDECPLPGQALTDLASVSAFNLFLTTTFDPLLQRAIDLARYGGEPMTEVLAFSPATEIIDLPSRRQDLQTETVFHLLGKVSAVPDHYVVWEGDMLDFMFALHDNLKSLERLGRDLKEHGLLFLGLNFSDWLVRFFLRISKQEPLSTPKVHRAYLAESPEGFPPNSLVMFFGAVSKNIQVLKHDPIAFCSELSKRWRARHPQSLSSVPLRLSAVPDEIPKGAIFISYAREDELAVIELVHGLKKVGCSVWYDRERLKGGENFHYQLEDAVKLSCGIFLSVISRTTNATRESYYHLERNWAAQRAEGIVHDEEFYIPVVIDDSALDIKREPKPFHKVHAIPLLEGVVTEEFAQKILRLQQKVMRSIE